MLKKLSQVARRVTGPKHRRGWLDTFEFGTVLDVGANTGQFAAEARRFAPAARIYSFEPLPDCYAELKARHGQDPRFRSFNVAVGDEPGETTFHRSAYAQSSSMLPMADLHKEAFPETAGGAQLTVKVETLDRMQEQLRFEGPVLVKIDVQGYEDRVIRGATEVLARADVVLCEMSIEPLYEGQTLFDGVYRMMVDRGFVYRGNHLQLQHPRDGRVLQVDGLFTRAAR